MDFQLLFDFLGDLQENNNKEWMDAHRSRYTKVRNQFINFLAELDVTFAQIDPEYVPTDARKALNRINNNLLFHPNKPVYKDSFGAGLDLAGHEKQGDFYLQIGVQGSFFAGGYYKPKKEFLDAIREAIDYNGEELKAIINKPSFKKMFGGLYDDGQSLVKAPMGYSSDHAHIDLLRLKTIAVDHAITREQVLSPDFKDYCVQVYKEMKPFRQYLNQAVGILFN